MKKLQFIDIGKPFRIIGKICKDIERAFRFKGINVNFIVMMIDYIGIAFIFKWNLQQVTPPLPVTVEVRILLPYDFKQTTLDGDKQLVHISLVGLPAAAEIRIGQFHIAAAFFDIYFSWCVFHR